MQLPREIITRTLETPVAGGAYTITEKLFDAGFEAYWVGGSVRDMALGKLPCEIDIATSALPKDIEDIFPKSDTSAAELGVVVISEAGHLYEVTTFREESVETRGRRPEKVHFSTKEKDAARRDATINALYFSPITKDIYDPYEGLKDAQEKLVRIIGNPKERLLHDPLRILRIVRLRASISGQYHPDTYAALSALHDEVTRLSGSRVLEELQKLLRCSQPAVGLKDYEDLGILRSLYPELLACKGVAQPVKYHKEGDVWNHLLQCVRSFSDDHTLDVRLSALLHDIGKAVTFSISDRIHFDKHAEESAKIARQLLQRLQMERVRADKISWLISHHMMMTSFRTLSSARKAHWYFHPWFTELLQLFWLDIAGSDPQDFSLYDSIITDYDLYLNEYPRPPKPLLKGEEVMKLAGLQPGAKVGEYLSRLHDLQLQGKISTKKEAKEALAQMLQET